MSTAVGPHYKWIALSNTTLGVLMATINQSIVLIALPDIFRGIGLNPLSPGNTSYLLWMFMGFLIVSAVLVVSFGRLGDMFGRVRMYNIGFAIFSIASIFLTITWMHGSDGALWYVNRANDTDNWSVGRITEAGQVTNSYTGTSIDFPIGIAAGPDGALWFTNEGTDAIDRITTTVTPKITKFGPASGPAGITVTITGLNLSGATAVSFDGTPAPVASDSPTQIQTVVPSGARTGHVTVTTPAGTATSTATFTVT